MATALKEMMGKQISVITCDGRNIVGQLRGYDQVRATRRTARGTPGATAARPPQVTNVILDECHERVFSLDAGVEQVVLGLYIIRGAPRRARIRRRRTRARRSIARGTARTPRRRQHRRHRRGRHRARRADGLLGAARRRAEARDAHLGGAGPPRAARAAPVMLFRP